MIVDHPAPHRTVEKLLRVCNMGCILCQSVETFVSGEWGCVAAHRGHRRQRRPVVNMFRSWSRLGVPLLAPRPTGLAPTQQQFSRERIDNGSRPAFIDEQRHAVLTRGAPTPAGMVLHTLGATRPQFLPSTPTHSQGAFA